MAEKIRERQRSVLICPHGLNVSGGIYHKRWTAVLFPLSVQSPSLRVFYVTVSYASNSWTQFIPQLLYVLNLHPAVSGRKWHLPWVLLDMQQVQISLDLPFPRKINSDTLGSELHPIVPCLHAFSSLLSKSESSHGLWSERTELDPSNTQILQETPADGSVSETRSRNKPNKEKEMERTSWGKERVSRETQRGLYSSPETGCLETQCGTRALKYSVFAFSMDTFLNYDHILILYSIY